MSPRRVRDLISLSIRLGYISADDPLVEHELIEIFNTSRTSVRAALAHLSANGIIERRPRAGTRITQPGITIQLPDFGTLDNEVALYIIEDRSVPAFPLVRDQLQLEDDAVRMVENGFTYRGVVIGLRTAYFSNEFAVPADRFDRPSPVSMLDVMADGFHTQPGEVVVRIGADCADGHDARVLGVLQGAPLIVRELTFYAADGRPLQMAFDRFRSDYVHFEDTTALVV